MYLGIYLFYFKGRITKRDKGMEWETDWDLQLASLLPKCPNSESGRSQEFSPPLSVFS